MANEPFRIKRGLNVRDGALVIDGITGKLTLSDWPTFAQGLTISDKLIVNANGADIHGTLTAKNDLVVDGNMTINGTTTIINSSAVSIDDPVFTLGGDIDPIVDDGKDRGIVFRWFDGTAAKTGFFGFDRDTGKFRFFPDSSGLTTEIFSGVDGTFVGTFEGNADTATNFNSNRTISVGGDVNAASSTSVDGNHSLNITFSVDDNKLVEDYIKTSEVDGSSIEFASGTLNVKADGITDAMINWGTGTNQVSTTDVPEGTNLYYTDTRTRASLSLSSSGDHGNLTYNSSTGAFVFTGVSQADVRGDVSGTDAGGDGSFAYDSSTGVFAYTGPSSAEVRAHFTASNADGLTYTESSGDFVLSQDIRATAAPTFAGLTVTGNLSINGTTTTINATQTDIVDPIILLAKDNSTADTRDIGFVGKYYDSTAQAIKHTAFFRDATNGKYRILVQSTQSGIENANQIDITLATKGTLIADIEGDITGQISDISNHDTNDLSEGSTNFYFTDARVDTRVASTVLSALSDVNNATPTDGQSLVWDNTNSYWKPYTVSGSGSGSPGGANTQVQFNNANAFGGDAGFTYNASTDAITAGSLIATGSSPQLSSANALGIATTASNGVIDLDPHGSGKVVFKGNATRGAGQFVLNCELNTHGITIKGPPHSAGANYTLILPNDDGSANQVLKTDGSGLLSWVNQPTIPADTDALSEGSTNLYFTDSRADARIAAADIDDLTDVNTSGFNVPTNGQALLWNNAASYWEPGNVSTGISSLSEGDGITAFTFDGTSTATVAINLADTDALEVSASGLDLKDTIAGDRSFTGNITIGSDFSFDNVAKIQTADYTMTATATETCDSFAITDFRSAKYVVQVTDGTDYQCSELIVLHDGTTPIVAEYGLIFTSANALASFDAIIGGGNVQLQATGNASAVIKLMRTGLVV